MWVTDQFRTREDYSCVVQIKVFPTKSPDGDLKGAMAQLQETIGSKPKSARAPKLKGKGMSIADERNEDLDYVYDIFSAKGCLVRVIWTGEKGFSSRIRKDRNALLKSLHLVE